MRRHPGRPRYAAAVAGTALAAVLAACSAGGGGSATSTSPAASTRAQQSAPEGTVSGPIGISPDGVTTRVDVPAESTEEQYAQACLAAKAWMESTGGDPATLIEPFLKQLQASDDAGPATFNTGWGRLSTAQQAAVIIAVQAAAHGGC